MFSFERETRSRRLAGADDAGGHQLRHRLLQLGVLRFSEAPGFGIRMDRVLGLQKENQGLG